MLHCIEQYAAEKIDRDQLAAIVDRRKCDFLTIFPHAVGMTPYQCLLSIRLRCAAMRLATTAETVASTAFEPGFGDLSTINNRFCSVFGVNPLQYRRRKAV